MKTIITLTNVVIIAASVFLLVVAAVSINKGKKQNMWITKSCGKSNAENVFNCVHALKGMGKLDIILETVLDFYEWAFLYLKSSVLDLSRPQNREFKTILLPPCTQRNPPCTPTVLMLFQVI